ncbi:MAG: LysR family transcriptional regulator [Proteobacteria bacterium]|nr:LysR family transcriptional regulator [Pseudomonadota bacterium]
MWSGIPNLRHLRAFCEVAETGSVTEAARRIHLTQPAISQALARLEERVGTPLFEQGTNRMLLTSAGTMLLPRVVRFLDLLRQGTREVRRIAGARSKGGFANFDHLLTVAQLNALSAMAEAGNFSLAARASGLTQPSIHRAARDLERLTGVALFEKTSQGVELTRAAAVLAQHARLALAELRQGITEIAEALGVDAGSIVIASLPLARSSILPAAIIRFGEDRPHTAISIIEGHYDRLLYGLRHGEIDLLIGALREPAPIGDVVETVLFSDTLQVVARAGHPLAGRSTLTLDDLERYPWVIAPPGAPTRGYFDALFKERDASKAGGLIEASSLVLLRGLLTDSDRLTIISGHQIVHEVRLGLLTILPFPLPGSDRRIGLTTRRGWHPTPTQKLFLECLHAVSREA